MSIYKKLLKIQKEIGAIKKTETNPYFKSKFFDINVLLETVKPTLNAEGIVLTQALSHVDGKLGLKTTLVDTDTGETIEDVAVLPTLDDPQKAGSAVTYFRRYAIQSLLALEAEDDDGNKASGKKIKNNDEEDSLPF
jgi:hypothetical protein